MARVLTDYRLSHLHSDGAWGEMTEVRDASEDDPERNWGRRRLFRCTVCDESAMVEPVVETDGEAQAVR